MGQDVHAAVDSALLGSRLQMATGLRMDGDAGLEPVVERDGAQAKRAFEPKVLPAPGKSAAIFRTRGFASGQAAVVFHGSFLCWGGVRATRLQPRHRNCAKTICGPSRKLRGGEYPPPALRAYSPKGGRESLRSRSPPPLGEVVPEGVEGVAVAI